MAGAGGAAQRNERPMAFVETAPTTKRCYSVFGLRVASRIAMPKLTPVEHRGDAPVDVQIDSGTVEPPPDGQRIAARDEALVLDYPPARFRIEAGQTITIEPNPGSSERDIRTFVLGSAFGAICHQRGLLPLHASVVEIDGRAVAFVGPQEPANPPWRRISTGLAAMSSATASAH